MSPQQDQRIHCRHYYYMKAVGQLPFYSTSFLKEVQATTVLTKVSEHTMHTIHYLRYNDIHLSSESP